MMPAAPDPATALPSTKAIDEGLVAQTMEPTRKTANEIR